MKYKGIFTDPKSNDKQELEVESETFLRACLLLLELAINEGIDFPLEHIVDEGDRWVRAIDFVRIRI